MPLGLDSLSSRLSLAPHYYSHYCSHLYYVCDYYEYPLRCSQFRDLPAGILVSRY